MNEGRNQTLSCEVGTVSISDKMKENAEEKRQAPQQGMEELGTRVRKR